MHTTSSAPDQPIPSLRTVDVSGSVQPHLPVPARGQPNEPQSERIVELLHDGRWRARRQAIANPSAWHGEPAYHGCR